VLQTLSAAPEEKGYALMNKTHPLPVDRIERLDRAMGPKFDTVTAVVEDLPSFVALRAAPAPAVKSTPARAPARARSRRRN
jgi:hypothetical protein